jgi:dipeptidyl-peptidase-4
LTFRLLVDQVTFLFPDGTGKRQLFCINLSDLNWDKDVTASIFKLIDPSESKEELSLEEQLRRERMRLFVEGISTYEWCNLLEAKQKQVILIPLNGKIFYFQHDIRPSSNPASENVEFHCVYEGNQGAAIDPHLAPNGEAVAFIINNDIHLQWLEGEKKEKGIQRMTFEGDKEGCSAGIADYVAQEEMSRYRGFWWSPNSRMIAFTKNDESKIPKFDILHQGKDDPLHTETHRYPFAGSLFILVVSFHSLYCFRKKKPICYFVRYES